jgi:hypothetical protein
MRASLSTLLEFENGQRAAEKGDGSESCVTHQLGRPFKPSRKENPLIFSVAAGAVQGPRITAGTRTISQLRRPLRTTQKSARLFFSIIIPLV